MPATRPYPSAATASTAALRSPTSKDTLRRPSSLAIAEGDPGTWSGAMKLASSRRDPPSGGRSIAISQCAPGMPQTVSTNSPLTDPVPSTSRPSRTKNAVAESRSATVMPMWSKRRTCAMGPILQDSGAGTPDGVERWLPPLRGTATLVYIAALCLAVALLVIAFIPGSPVTLALPTAELPGTARVGGIVHGVVIDPGGEIVFKVTDPSLGQRMLHLLTTFPGLLLVAEVARR